jgi:hypothetical protein
MQHLCPICKRKLTKEHNISFIDYHCFPSSADHHYTSRLKDDQILQVKVRLKTLNGERVFFKLYFDEGYSEVWTKINDTNRVRINHVFMPDFNQPDKLVKKLLTYLIFS